MAKKKDTTGEVKIADAFAAKTLGYNSVEEMNADKKRREKLQETVGGEWDEETATQELKQKEAEYQKSIGLSKALRDNSEKGWKDRAYNSFTSGQDRVIINALGNNLSFDDAYKAYSENADDYNFDLNEVYRGNVEQLKNMFRARYDELAGVYGMNAPEVAEETADVRATKGLDKLQQRDARKTQRLESRNARIAARELRNNARELKRDARRELRTSERELARDIRDLRIPTESAQPSAPISTPTLSTDAERALEALTPKTGYNESPEYFKRELATTTMPYVGVEDEVVPEDEVAAYKETAKEEVKPTNNTPQEAVEEAAEDKDITTDEKNEEFDVENEVKSLNEDWGSLLDQVFGVNKPEQKKDEYASSEAVNASAPNMQVGVKPIDETIIKESVRQAPTGNSQPAITPKELTAEERASKARLEAYNRYATAVGNNLSAYQELIKKSIAKKEEIAQRRERNARSVALANALGSLTNAITANALANKNGTIPIYSQHDKEPDTNLRKSIEGRYDLQNENENLLLKLAQERRAHEAELANNTLKAELADINARERSEIYERKRQREQEDWEKREAVKHQNNMDKIEARGNNAVKVTELKGEQKAQQAAQKAQQKAQQQAQKEASKPYEVKDKTARDQFVNATTIAETTRKNAATGDEIKETKQNKNLVPYMKKAYEYFEKEGLTADEMTKAASVLKEIARTHSSALMSNISDSLNEMVKNLIKDKKNFSADQIVQIITNAIEKSKTN